MSLNKVLNRPLFRQQALKKGVLKPIKAFDGRMIGMPTGGSSAYNPNRVPVVVPQPGLFSRAGQFLKRTGRDIRSFPRSVPGQVMNPRTRVPFGMGGGISRLFVAPMGTYDAVSAMTDKIGMKPGMLKTGVDFGLSGLALLNPYTRAAGLAYGAYNLARPLVGGAIDYVTQKPIGTTSQALDVRNYLGEPIQTSLFSPIDTSKRETRKERRDRKKLERVAQAEGSEVGIVPDQLTQPQNETQLGQTEVVDLNKTIRNRRGESVLEPTVPVQTVAQVKEQPSGIDGGLEGPVGVEGKDISIKPKAPVKENALQQAQKIYQDSTEGKGTERPIGGKLFTSDLIERAKQIRSELGQDPQGDLARTTFLSTLAAGLMGGTTRKRGLGGALEVFGNALGPAVSNYAVMKLKQNELENKSMETYLGYALDEMKLFNEALAGEPFGGELGVVQFIDDNGNTINVKGRQTKGGTIEFATGQIGPRGNEIYASISSQANVPGFGKVNQFLDKKTVDTETIKIGEILSGRYKTFKITNDVLDTIAEQPKSVGPAGAINLFKTRVGSALSDLGFSFGASKEEARGIAESYRAQIEASDLDEDTKKRLLKSTDFNKLYKDAEKRIKSRVGGKVDSETLEELAVAETTLVYALANSFKDKDRLTARDVAAAEKLVNLFTLTRGSKAVEASIRAIGKQLQDDIIRYENDYRRVGGLERTLQNMRQQNQFRLTGGGTITDQFIKTLDEAGLLEEFNK